VAVKTSRIVSNEPISWLKGIASTQLTGSEKASLDSLGSQLRDEIGGLRGGRPFLCNSTDMVEKDNYQVALIPLPDPVKHSGADGPALAKMNSVFVLPMTWKDLVTRLRSEDKWSGSNRESDVVGFGAVCVNLSRMEVRRAGEPVVLTPLEFKLLRYFMLNPARVISRDELLNEVWGFDNYPCTRTVDSHMWRLRKKLEADPASPAHFHTVHAVGYKFVP
jgi:DNA-binding winged helix-turn-helix (wHTH) protein